MNSKLKYEEMLEKYKEIGYIPIGTPQYPYFIPDISEGLRLAARNRHLNEFQLKSNWKEWSKTLPQAYEIYDLVFGGPKTHREWADRFNKVGEINRILQRKSPN